MKFYKEWKTELIDSFKMICWKMKENMDVISLMHANGLFPVDSHRFRIPEQGPSVIISYLSHGCSGICILGSSSSGVLQLFAITHPFSEILVYISLLQIQTKNEHKETKETIPWNFGKCSFIVTLHIAMFFTSPLNYVCTFPMKIHLTIWKALILGIIRQHLNSLKFCRIIANP